MDRALRNLVRERAGYRCEYCHLPETAVPAASFHIEHIIARQHQGEDDPDNLAESCHRCNASKGPNLSGRDSKSGKIVLLFNPRRQRWARHFRWSGPRLQGRTQTGRATVAVLNINEPRRVLLRAALIEEGLLTLE